MSTTTLIRDQIEQSDLLFNVRSESMVSASGIEIPNKRVLINEGNQQPLGIVGPNYKVVTNHEMVEALLGSLEKSDLDLTDADLAITQSHNGARAMLNLRLPAYSFKVAKDKSDSIMEITALNSLDGRWKYQSKVGAFRMKCLNGNLLGAFIGTYSEYHNGKLDVAHGADRLVEMLSKFEQSQTWFENMVATKVDKSMVETILVYLLKSRFTDDMSEDDIAHLVNTPTYKKLYEMFEAYKHEMGSNMYALYNAMTDYVSNKKYGPNTAAAAKLSNQQKLERTLRLPVFDIA